ncbi:hypothetical protein BWZ20_09330 [Winogradskyella sp. J14-2]|uniref:O-antigen ligase family protein n=1 Tax=Winogradskyella sp. J14-2 TaxID=1936080 RepID=UPI000972671C|nr:O-antigen ligase family protein [Winogradskyella sp. J14-2]APY08488.1 hypothetical protein BWZ20_09330 [Winogradskyella sp. J14-2]
MIKHRDSIIYSLYGIICLAFILSYAITNIASVLLLAMFFIDNKSELVDKFKYIKTNKIIGLYIAFFVIQLVGLIYTSNLNEGLRRITVMLPLLFLPMVVISERKNDSCFARLMSVLQFAIPIIFVVLIFFHVFYDDRVISTFVHFTIEEKLGISQFYLVFILILPLYVSYQKILDKNKVLLSSLTFLTTLGIVFILGNKTIIILLFILVGFYFINNLKNLRKFILSIVALVILGVASFNIPIVKERFVTMFKTMDFDMEVIKTKNSFTVTKNTLEHRILINYLSFNEIIEALPFGVGTGDVEDVLKKQYKEANFKAGMLNNFNSHNQYFYEFFKTGLLGGVTFIVLLFFLIERAYHSNGLALILTIFFALACFIESYLFRQHGVTIFAFVIPLFLNQKLKTNHK